MKKYIQIGIITCLVFFIMACDRPSGQQNGNTAGSTGLKIAYVNGDTILLNYKAFRNQSENMDAKQQAAQDQLQSKGAALEKEINDYQQRAQKGTMTGKEMQAHEKYLSTKQEALLAERDKVAKEIMDETNQINDRLQRILQEKLNAIKKREGYDFIFSYIHGGSILVADEKYDITQEVLKELNKESLDLPEAKDTSNHK